jgi:hypothetical protein
MIILKVILLILALYFTVSITLRTLLIHAEVKYGRPTNTPQITVGRVLGWAISTGLFVYLQFIL